MPTHDTDHQDLGADHDTQRDPQPDTRRITRHANARGCTRPTQPIEPAA